MKIKMLKCMAGERSVKNVGDEIEVNKKTAEAWRKAGIAEIVEEKQLDEKQPENEQSDEKEEKSKAKKDEKKKGDK